MPYPEKTGKILLFLKKKKQKDVVSVVRSSVFRNQTSRLLDKSLIPAFCPEKEAKNCARAVFRVMSPVSEMGVTAWLAWWNSTRNKSLFACFSSEKEDFCSFSEEIQAKRLLRPRCVTMHHPTPRNAGKAKNLCFLCFPCRRGVLCVSRQKNIRDDVDFRNPRSSSFCQARKAGANKESDNACHGVREGDRRQRKRRAAHARADGGNGQV